MRDVDALETPLLPSCLVGDFAGDLIPLMPGLGPDVGLAPSVLPLLPGPSIRLCLFSPFATVCTLLGLAFPGTPLPVVFGFDFASSRTCRTPDGLKNIPYPCAHWKYLSPLTEPSFFPVASSSSTPTQSPVWKCVIPTKRTIATRPSLSSIFCPTERDAVLIVVNAPNGQVYRASSSFGDSRIHAFALTAVCLVEWDCFNPGSACTRRRSACQEFGDSTLG